MDWIEYFQRRPIGWRDDHRASYSLSAAGVKAKPYELFDSLRCMEKDRQEIEENSIDRDASKLVNSGFFAKLINETGWDVEVE